MCGPGKNLHIQLRTTKTLSLESNLHMSGKEGEDTR